MLTHLDNASPNPTQKLSRGDMLRTLTGIVGPNGVLHEPEDLLVYNCDALTLVKQDPMVVVLPTTTEEVSQVLRFSHKNGIPVVPRGAGTCLSGGTLAAEDGITLCLTRMNQIDWVDVPNRRLCAQAGVTNLQITQAVSSQGYFFAPDPSSQMACTIGGNVAENSGGPHTLRHGVTTNHVLAVELVLPNGEVVWLGSSCEDQPGYDLTGLVVGSEGTLGVVTRAIVRLSKSPESVRTFLAVFDTVSEAGKAVSAIIASGIVPVALEMMDSGFIKPVEETYHFGLPLDAEAVLIVEMDGLMEATESEVEIATEICRQGGAREVRTAASEEERLHLWKARKGAFAVIGRIATNYCTQDGTVPRGRIPEMLATISDIGKKHDVRIVNVFHAGDGNMHPVLLYDERDKSLVQRALDASYEILKACVDFGGSITGEHGVGVEKLGMLHLCYPEATLRLFADLRHLFNPANLLNPGKAILAPGEKSKEELMLRPPAAL